MLGHGPCPRTYMNPMMVKRWNEYRDQKAELPQDRLLRRALWKVGTWSSRGCCAKGNPPYYGKVSRKITNNKRRNILEEDYYHRIKCSAPNQLVTFMWKWPLSKNISVHNYSQKLPGGFCWIFL